MMTKERHFCECGCGRVTSLAKSNDKRKGWKRGQPVRFILGHGTRQPHWNKAKKGELICPGCKKSKPKNQFDRNRSSSTGRSTYCKSCSAKRRKETYNRDGGASWRDYRYRKLYGITFEQYSRILKRQRGVCAICKRKVKTRKLALDHCHKTGKVRGVLCTRCNSMIAFAEDNPLILESAIRYLQK